MKNNDKVNITQIRVDTIHSINTFNTYMQHCNAFVEWCINEKGINKNIEINKIEYLAKEYLAYREAEGKSLYTLKSEKAALGKLYQHEIDYKFKDKRSYDKITRSRNESIKDKHFSEEKNKDLVNIAKATGGRREDLSKLTPSSFFEIKGQLYVNFNQSKGGRDRTAPILPEYQKEIKEFIKDKQQNEKLFERINTNADIHSYRREYAKSLYELVKNNKEKREEYSKIYPQRNEPNVKGDMYISHSKENQFKGKRDDIYIVSQSLGHNRLEITVNHYLK